MIVHRALEAFASGADSGRRRLVIHALGPGEDSGYGKVASAMLKLHVHRVVMRIAVPVAVDVEIGEILIRQPTCVRAGGYAEVVVRACRVGVLTERQAGCGNRERLRDVATVEQVNRMGSDIVHF